MVKPAAVIFDMDGLMLDTERPVLDFWIKAAEKFGVTVTRDTVFRTIGINEAGSRVILEEACGLDFPYDEIRAERNRMVREQVEREGIAQKKGLLTLLNHLDARGIKKALATSTARETALWKLKHAGIPDRFEIMVCGDEVKNGKPAPDIFLRAVEKLGVPASDCVGFEDSPAGLQALHAAKIPSVFVKDLVEPPEETLATVWRRCENLAEAAELFG
ncbi:phosphorylated carbohydrates phosphatase [Spirochaetia bacterium]|nr:phosphorylated carbohydrates phosphatase [Spirochaetia bacterium]